MESNRERGAIAKVLDNDALLEIARKAFIAEYPEEDPAQLINIYRQMIFTVNRGEVAVVNTEGVGTIANEDNIVGLFFGYNFNIIQLEIKVEDLGAVVTDKEIDLADGIRTFGSRLDSNHYRWYSIYDGK